MEVFRELYVPAEASQMASVVAQIEHAAPSGWIRDRTAENRARSTPTGFRRLTFCFQAAKDGRRPAATLILAQKDISTFYVSNIIPLDRDQLSRAEYNDVLMDFYQRVIRPTAESVGMTPTLTDADAGLEQWMSPQTAEKLRQFSESANKSTGSSHPNDRKRWNDFVLSAQKEHSRLDPSTLQRWLVEVEDWPPEIAEQLAVEYESGRELLAFAGSA